QHRADRDQHRCAQYAGGLGRARPRRAATRHRASVPGSRIDERRALHVARRAELRAIESARGTGTHFQNPAARADGEGFRVLPMTADEFWYKDGIIYQTHVRAFFDSNNDGIGDFQGLTRKLDYLQDLGVNILWLLPFYPSPLRDDGYDIADYTAVNPSYG